LVNPYEPPQLHEKDFNLESLAFDGIIEKADYQRMLPRGDREWWLCLILAILLGCILLVIGPLSVLMFLSKRDLPSGFSLIGFWTLMPAGLWFLKGRISSADQHPGNDLLLQRHRGSHPAQSSPAETPISKSNSIGDGERADDNCPTGYGGKRRAVAEALCRANPRIQFNYRRILRRKVAFKKTLLADCHRKDVPEERFHYVEFRYRNST
jgi:hypothetical protein